MNNESFGKSIKIFLMDGTPNGRMTCELSNWIGKAYKIPRTMVKDCAGRNELMGTGVYLLFGKDPADPDHDMVYIGETDGLLERLKEHQEKEFWNEVIAIISKDENLNKAHVRYLENKLYSLAVKADRYMIANNKIPSGSLISEADQAEMEEFAENIKLLVNTLAHKVFEEIQQVRPNDTQEYIISSVRGANAKGHRTSEGFVVLSGSTISTELVNSFPDSYKTLRQELLNNNIVVDQNGTLVFSKDYLFSSPSAAAIIVMGRSANGLTEWKQPDGTTLRDFDLK